MFNKDKLIQALENKMWSAYKLWKVSGVSQSVISDIINGKVKNPTVKTLSKLADALGVSVNEFFDEEDNESIKEKTDKSIKKDLSVIPEEFTNPDDARIYVKKHKIFASEGFNVDRLSDEEVLSFANALLEQMKLVGYKYKK
ncbi:helix-turn-helix domain-containing protein [Clostridium cochlearium]|uniref:helix-turn-helix domain-containing protein n=1 Tax=Clostridium cochlearium TaxID=1494 RepID=UPI003F65F6F6